jgi:hypothetical protein
MWMTDYIREIKRQLRDRYGFVPDGGTADDPTFSGVPDGEYPMEIEGRLDRVKVVDCRFQCCNFEEGEGPKP